MSNAVDRAQIDWHPELRHQPFATRAFEDFEPRTRLSGAVSSTSDSSRLSSPRAGPSPVLSGPEFQNHRLLLREKLGHLPLCRKRRADSEVYAESSEDFQFDFVFTYESAETSYNWVRLRYINSSCLMWSISTTIGHMGTMLRKLFRATTSIASISGLFTRHNGTEASRIETTKSRPHSRNESINPNKRLKVDDTVIWINAGAKAPLSDDHLILACALNEASSATLDFAGDSPLMDIFKPLLAYWCGHAKPDPQIEDYWRNDPSALFRRLVGQANSFMDLLYSETFLESLKKTYPDPSAADFAYELTSDDLKQISDVKAFLEAKSLEAICSQLLHSDRFPTTSLRIVLEDVKAMLNNRPVPSLTAPPELVVTTYVGSSGPMKREEATTTRIFNQIKTGHQNLAVQRSSTQSSTAHSSKNLSSLASPAAILVNDFFSEGAPSPLLEAVRGQRPPAAKAGRHSPHGKKKNWGQGHSPAFVHHKAAARTNNSGSNPDSSDSLRDHNSSHELSDSGRNSPTSNDPFRGSSNGRSKAPRQPIYIESDDSEDSIIEASRSSWEHRRLHLLKHGNRELFVDARKKLFQDQSPEPRRSIDDEDILQISADMGIILQIRGEEQAAEKRAEDERIRKEAEEKARREEEEKIRKLTGLRPPKRTLIADLNDGWVQRVRSSMSATQTVVASTPARGEIRGYDLSTVVPYDRWLNDEIVNGVLSWLDDYVNKAAGIKDVKTQTRKLLAFNSFFYGSLGRDTTRILKRLGITKDNFLSVELMLIPVCQANHWTLLVVRPTRRTVAHLDSFRPEGRSEYKAQVMKWIAAFLQEKYVADEWKLVVHDAPSQLNGYDCGVHAVTNGVCLALGLNPADSYRREQLPMQRLRIAAILLNGGFHGDFDLVGL